MATQEEPSSSKKRARTEPEPSETASHPMIAFPKEKGKSADATELTSVVLMDSRPARLTADINPLLIKRLEARNELGFRRPLGHKKPELVCCDVNITYFRSCIEDVLSKVLFYRFHNSGSYRATEIAAEIKDIVPLTIDICMSALYAKFRAIHKSYGTRGTRYGSSPLYTKEIELPLPLALAIEQFGAFETHSLQKNWLLAPTYPEGVLNEGRVKTEFTAAQYLAYVPTFKELGIPCKALDTRLKAGTAWWTYKTRNIHETTDLVCTLPASHYSDLSADLRLLFISRFGTKKTVEDLITFIEPLKDKDFGTRDREERSGVNVRTFLALCHGPEEEWTHGD